ncbi:MAG: leucine-rich repeat domain-containing protein [Clostridia bacterium]|nr:leucine-rich repeat domain-containing protein [Clostridia bacterium]
MASKTFRKKTEYHRLYSRMRGVDLSGDGSAVSPERFAYLENLWRDYGGDNAGMTESVVGFRRLTSFDGAIHAIYRQRAASDDYILVHAGNGLFRFPLAARDAAAPERLCDIADGPSCAFSFEDRCYVFDGTRMIAVGADGVCGVVGEDIAAYIPTTYENGIALEQPNFLSELCYESYTLTLPELLSFGSVGLSYEPDPDGDGSVRVCGIGEAYDTILYIPARIRISGVEYAVSSIADMAFASCTSLRQVHIAQGVERIGEWAFSGCTNLQTVVMQDSLRTVGAHAFDGCSSLLEVFLGMGIDTIGEEAFTSCPSTMNVLYALDAYHLTLVMGASQLNSFRLYYAERRCDVYLEVPLYSNLKSVRRVYVNGVDTPHDVRYEGGRAVGVQLYFNDRHTACGKVIVVEGRLLREDGTTVNGQHSFFTSHPAYRDTPASVITRCTLCASFDGRLFVSGHPSLPGVLFYNQRTRYGVTDPTYFGVLNYVTDGVGLSPIVSLLPTAGALVVFKAEDDGGGSIFYHTPESTGDALIPKLYPVAYTHTGLGAFGASISFLDDPVFIGSSGLMALDRQNLALERSIAVRSHMVSDRLLCEDLGRIRLAIWCGYLVLSVDGRMYLADSRQTFRHSSGYTEYEWYVLNGIGCYANDETVYRYASVASAGYTVSDTPDAIVEEPVLTATDAQDGAVHTYVARGHERIEVYPTEQRRGGVFSAATSLLGFDDLLFFGTDTGELCLFNNDRRGVAPARIAADAAFDADSYRQVAGRHIHPDFYDFDGHAVRYALRTAADNVGIPHMTKSTVRGSLVVKCRTVGAQPLIVEVGTDRRPYREVTAFPTSPVSFDDLDFSSLTWETDDTFTVPLREREKRWIEKQIAIYSESFRSPIGLSSIAYRFTVQGNVKGH